MNLTNILSIKYVPFLSSLFLSFAFTSNLAKSDTNIVVTQAFQKRACARQSEEPAKRIDFLLKKYFVNEKSVNHIPANFSHLQSVNSEVLNKLGEISKKYSSVSISTKEEYDANLQGFLKEVGELQSGSYGKLFFKQRLFTSSMLPVEEDIRDVRVQAASIEKMVCSEKSKKNLKEIKTLSERMEKQAASYRLLAEKQMLAVPEAIESLKAAMRGQLAASFARTTGKKVDELIGLIDSANKAFEFTDETSVWYQEAWIKFSSARYLWSKYYLFNDSVNLLSSDIARGEKLQSKLETLGLDEDHKKIVGGQLSLQIKSLREYKDMVEKSGVAEAVSKHKKLVSYVQTNPKRWESSFCDSEFEAYKFAVEKMTAETTVESFKVSEPTIKKFLSLCFYKE